MTDDTARIWERLAESRRQDTPVHRAREAAQMLDDAELGPVNVDAYDIGTLYEDVSREPLRTRLLWMVDSPEGPE